MIEDCLNSVSAIFKEISAKMFGILILRQYIVLIFAQGEFISMC